VKNKPLLMFIGIVAVFAAAYIYSQYKKVDMLLTERSPVSEEVVRSVAECDALPQLLLRINCYAEVAIQQNDISVCDASAHEGVRYRCYQAYAVFSKDAGICEQIPANGATLEQTRNLCFAEAAKALGDYKICQNISDDLEDECYLRVSISTQNEELCAMIVSQVKRDACYSSAF
jgi:hypothetical protein